MVQLYAFCRSLHLAALVLCAAAVVVSATPASARSHRGIERHFHRHHFRRHLKHHARREHHYRHYRHVMHRSRWDDGMARMQQHGLANANASLPPGAAPASAAMTGGFGSSDVVAEARRYIGGNPTSRRSLWCARFMNMVLQRSGHRGTGSDMANSFAHYGERVAGPQIGAIAVMGRRGGGHVGVVSGIDAHGNPILVSGNNRNQVREAPVSRGRIYAYVMPSG